VVTVCTTCFNITRLFILPTECIYEFHMILRTIAIISLNNINWLVFAEETHRVLYGVGTEIFYII
jgi:hypothetical protein